jgi:hypothetical protein
MWRTYSNTDPHRSSGLEVYLNNKMLSLVLYRVIKAASIAEKIHNLH